jgi:hypothetical protein
MFIGHFALGFASKQFAPRTSLALLIAAPIFLDILWPIFVLLGWERVRIDPGNTVFTPLDFVYFPWSHSLLMSLVWATALALLYQGFAHYWAGTVAIWIGVVSHWILDWISHRPDMPLYPSGPTYGIGLWNSVAATMIVELGLLSLGVGLYVKATRARDATGRYAFYAYVLFLILAYFGDRLGGTPSSIVEIVATSIVAQAILIAWAAWFDTHRNPFITADIPGEN